MSCPKMKIPWPRVLGEPTPSVDHDQENWKAVERWADGILKCIPGQSVTWASFTQTLPITYSAGNVITNAVENNWVLEYEGTGATGFGPGTGAFATSFYVDCPAGTYVWTLELWGSDNWDGIITYSDSATDGTACAYLHTEVIGSGSGGFNKVQYHDEPVFKGISGGALVRTGTTSTSTGHIYVEVSFRAAPWLSDTGASGTIKAHLTLIRIDDAQSLIIS